MAREPMTTGLVLAGSFAGWALAVAVAAWSGLGSGLGAAPPPAEPAPLPVLPVLPDDRLGALGDYRQTTARPLFNEGRRPQPYAIGGDEPAAGGALRLTGVMLTPMANVAILSGEGGLSLRLHLGGAAVQGWQLLELSPRQATVLGPSGTQVLLLATYDGSADPATAAVASPERAPAAASPVPAARAEEPVPPPPPPPPAAEAPANVAEPSAAQMQAIRERIQARRRQMQQNTNGQNPGQNK